MLICSLLPAVLLIGYVRYRDRRRPEPMMRIIQAVIYGLFSAFLAVPLAMALEGLVYSSGYGIFAVLPFVRGVFSAFVGAAIPEESMKLLMLWLMLRNCDDFDEALDGIVYAVCIGMGFAGIENVLYVFQSEDGWATTALMRSLLAVPGHYIFAVLMGFFYSLAHFFRATIANTATSFGWRPYLPTASTMPYSWWVQSTNCSRCSATYRS